MAEGSIWNAGTIFWLCVAALVVFGLVANAFIALMDAWRDRRQPLAPVASVAEESWIPDFNRPEPSPTRRVRPRATRPPVCPQCGETALPVSYGFPGPELFLEEKAGNLILGGCIPSEVEFRCPGCGLGLARAPWAARASGVLWYVVLENSSPWPGADS